METDAIISSPPSSINSTVNSTFTDILQLSSLSLNSSCDSSSSSPCSSDQNDETTEEEIRCSPSSSISFVVDGHNDNCFCDLTRVKSDSGVIGVLNDEGELIVTRMNQSNSDNNNQNEDTNNNNNNTLIIDECKICYQELPITQRFCCDYITCWDCLRKYFASQIEMGSMRIECINVHCHSLIDPEEIAANLDNKLREIYFRLIQENNCNLTSKTCPSCSTMYTLKSSQQLRTMKKISKKDPSNSRVKCPECKYYWCFLCHAPWHQGLTCGQYRQGDRLLKVWAKQLSQGQLNAQRCPKCKTFIQKSGGCDHMHCNRCKTGFCYRCGEPLRRLKFFGDHYSKFSIFGCKYRYKKESPIQRKAIRGAVFASKLFLAPILGSLIFCAGTLFVSVAVAFLPFYGVITVYKRYSSP